MTNILIVEDDIMLLEGLSYILVDAGFDITPVQRLKDARSELKKNNCDLIVLDCNLPDGNGFDFCEEIKRRQSPRVLILTCRNKEVDELKAFKVGADEYISKPFSTAVLIERIKRLLKRQNISNRLLSNGVDIDLLSASVKVNNVEIELTAREFKLLCYFIKNKNILLTKDMIVSHVWGNDGEYTDDNNLFVRINRLRKKIECDSKKPKRISTIHGVGYIWRED